MMNPFFDRPILNSPYELPRRHWELDADGKPTQQVIESRRRADFITPIPKPKKRRGVGAQQSLLLADDKHLTTAAQTYDVAATLNQVREGGDRQDGVGDPAQRHLAGVRQAEVRAHRGEGDQSPGGRGDEGLPGVIVRPQRTGSSPWR